MNPARTFGGRKRNQISVNGATSKTIVGDRMPVAPDCWLLSDGVAGNLRQARALAAALGLVAEAVTIRLRRPWHWLAPSGPADVRRALAPDAAARFVPPWPALAIGCGRTAALATLGLARLSGGHTGTVQILDPRRHRHRFDAVVVPAHDGLTGSNVITTLGSLNDIDAAWLARGRQAFASLAALPAPRVAVLVGGPTRALALDERYLDGLLATLAHWAGQGASFLVTCSRRTPPVMAARLRQRFAAWPGQFWAGPDDGANPYAGLLGWADRIIVTPDSANLMSEACATGVPVLVHDPARVRGKMAQLLQALMRSGRIRPLQASFQAFSAPPLRQMPAIAAAVRQRLGWPDPA